MKHIFKALTFFTITLAQADVIHNPGDPVIAMFDQARIEATTRISRLKSCSLKYVASVEDERWILQRQYDLAQDLSCTRHYWYSDQNTVCGITQFYRNSDLQLFHPACSRLAQTSYEAQFFLIKATVQHFGVYDEITARRLSSAILNADLNCQPSIPHCTPGCPYPHCCLNNDEEDEIDEIL